MRKFGMALACAGLLAGGHAPAATPDEATRFGKRESVSGMSLSPDGTRIAFVAPSATGQGATLYVKGVEEGSPQSRVMTVSGKPERLDSCSWVAAERLICRIFTVTDAEDRLVTVSRLIAIDANGQNLKVVSARENFHSRGYALGGGDVIDWLPDGDGQVLMARPHLADDRVGSHIGSSARGLAVDRVDTRTLSAVTVEKPLPSAVDYISDGRGEIRIRGLRRMIGGSGMDSGVTRYFYRPAGSKEWRKLSEHNSVDGSGFQPLAVDHDRNVAYGFAKKDGRLAFYSVALDGSGREEMLYARPDVDVDGLIRIGRRRRVVGVSYATDIRKPVYFDPAIAALTARLTKALPHTPLVRVIDSSVDENRLLIFAGSDDDPGAYFVLDRTTNRLQTLHAVRGDLMQQRLATVKSIRYAAADGTMVPAYLTLPPGKEEAKGLPAIVLPHGGPSARDEWGFDWLSQFYAARGYAVLQPNFRGSSGYGDAWFQQNGFRSWAVAIGDVNDAGRWLVTQGIADPAKLGIVGWSYGGYAALQSAVVDPTLFKAVVAIAPVTDLATLKTEADGWSDDRLIQDFIGSGPHVRDGSPARNAARIKAPVLLFHGTLDRNVAHAQSRLMNDKLAESGVRHELVTYEGLDHYLDDSAARVDLLRRSEGFLHSAMGV